MLAVRIDEEVLEGAKSHLRGYRPARPSRFRNTSICEPSARTTVSSHAHPTPAPSFPRELHPRVHIRKAPIPLLFPARLSSDVSVDSVLSSRGCSSAVEAQRQFLVHGTVVQRVSG